jgi:hypothetical protein
MTLHDQFILDFNSIRFFYIIRSKMRGEERSCNSMIPDHRKGGNKKEMRGKGKEWKELDRKGEK